MARRVLSSGAALCLGLCLLACKRERPAPTNASAPASASADAFAENARSARFDSELKRARTRWLEKPDLGNCHELMPKGADAELCATASSALAAVLLLDPAAPPESALPVLADAALALVRLLDRARYLEFEDFGRRRLDGDAGAPTGEASAAAAASASAGSRAQKIPRGLHDLLREHRTLKIVDSPLMRLVENSARVERDVLRQLGAYLEYAPLALRRAAFGSVKQLQAEHPRWPTLNHLLQEAAVLETDSQLKQSLKELVSSSLPQRKRPG